MASSQRLPIHRYRSRILETVAQHPVTIIAGEPGCGKTTEAPRFLLDRYADKGTIVVTQPRRLAAEGVAHYVARQMGEKLGGLVGYTVRFEQEFSDQTKLLFMTEGILANTYWRDQELGKYSVIILDEIHERSINMDVCLGIAKLLTSRRTDLRVVLMSATLDVRKFRRYFDGPPVIEVPSQPYPVDVRYIANADPHDPADIAWQLRTICQKPAQEYGHGVIVFLPGEKEIYEVSEALEQDTIPATSVMPLHGSQTLAEQEKVFLPSPRGLRKIVLSTNIAETSLTVPDISVIVDTGLIREADFDPKSGMNTLLVRKHSRAGCEQRTGRAGRLGPGVCYRLFSSDDFAKRLEFSEPEICRIGLSQVYLSMRAAGITDPLHFPLLDPPEPEAFHEAKDTLRIIGAIDDTGRLTTAGWRMVRLPIEPRLAKVILTAEDAGCLQEALTICAVLNCRPIKCFPGDENKRKEARSIHALLDSSGSDCLQALAIFNLWQSRNRSESWCRANYLNVRALREIEAVRNQLVDLLVKRNVLVGQSTSSDPAALSHALIAGFGDQLWHRTDKGRYEQDGKEWCYLPASSAAHAHKPEWFICASVLRMPRAVAKGVHPVDPIDIVAGLTGDTCSTARLSGLHYNPKQDAVVVRVLSMDPLHLVCSTQLVPAGRAEATQFLAEALAEGRLVVPSTAGNQLLIRELDELYNRMGARVPTISQAALLSFYREQLGEASTLTEAQMCDLQLSVAVLQDRFHCDINVLRAERDYYYPDSLELNGHLHQLQYEHQVATLTLSLEEVKALPYDLVVLPGGDPVQIEMLVPMAGSREQQRIVSTSVEELKRIKANEEQTYVDQASAQAECDKLREQLLDCKRNSTLNDTRITELQILLRAAEQAAYSWKPDLAEIGQLLTDLKTQIATGA